MDVTTALIALAGLFLAHQLAVLVHRKLFLEFNDDIPTILVNPLKQTPEQIRKMHMGPKMGMKGLGLVYRTVNMWKPWIRNITVGDPMLLKDIFVSKNWEKFDRQHPMSEPHFPYTAGFIHARNGTVWRDTKSLFERTFSTTSVKKYAPIVVELRDILMQQLEAANGKQGFDAYPLFHRFTFDTITRLTFGSEVRAMTTATGSEYTDRFERWMAGAAKMSAMLQLLGKWAYILIPSVVKQWKEDGDAMFGLVRGEMARVRRGEARNSILDDTMAHLAAGAKESGTMTDAQLELACMSLLFGGHDTTSALLGFLTYELSKRPDIQKGLRDELATLPAGPIDSLEPLESLPLLNAVIKETLRKYPSAPFGATRNMYEPYTHEYIGVDGTPRRIEFRKGDRLITYIWGIQRWPGFWEKDPEEWAPERFLENPSGDTKVGLYAYSPFGNGARRCLGERLALGEARLTVASIVRRWEIVPAFGEGEAFEELYQGTIRPSKVMIKLVEVANKA